MPIIDQLTKGQRNAATWVNWETKARNSGNVTETSECWSAITIAHSELDLATSRRQANELWHKG